MSQNKDSFCDKTIPDVIKKMIKVLGVTKNGCGLNVCQVGYASSIIAIRPDGPATKISILINPVIIEESEEKESATGKTGEATGETGEATGKTDTAQASAKTRVVKLATDYPKSAALATVALGVLATATYSLVL